MDRNKEMMLLSGIIRSEMGQQTTKLWRCLDVLMMMWK